MFINRFHPFSHILKRFVVSNIERNNDSIRLLIKCVGEGPELFLACSIPNFNFKFAVRPFRCVVFDHEVEAEGRHVRLLEFAISVTFK